MDGYDSTMEVCVATSPVLMPRQHSAAAVDVAVSTMKKSVMFRLSLVHNMTLEPRAL